MKEVMGFIELSISWKLKNNNEKKIRERMRVTWRKDVVTRRGRDAFHVFSFSLELIHFEIKQQKKKKERKEILSWKFLKNPKMLSATLQACMLFFLVW